MTAQPTNLAFVTAVQDMLVEGVMRHFNEPPTSIFEGDLPAAFPTMPSGSLGDRMVSCTDNNKVRSIGYVVLIEAVGLDYQSIKYEQLAPMMDNLETALDALTIGNFIDYTISATGNYQVAGNTYWAIVAEITARHE